MCGVVFDDALAEAMVVIVALSLSETALCFVKFADSAVVAAPPLVSVESY